MCSCVNGQDEWKMRLYFFPTFNRSSSLAFIFFPPFFFSLLFRHSHDLCCTTHPCWEGTLRWDSTSFWVNLTQSACARI